ncbi:MAG: hypothetical protein AB1758_07255 [Candidatus Eremiobacterota bacterium]
MKRGVTLAEVLLTMFLFILMLGVAGTLVREYSGVLRHSSSKERTLRSALVGLDRIDCELAQAHAVVSPATSTPVSLLEFRKLDPGAARLPAPPTPVPAGWAPHDPAYEVTVRYRVLQGTLIREVVGGGAPMAVVQGPQGLNAVLLPNGNVEVSLSIQEDKLLRTLSTEVFLPSLR